MKVENTIISNMHFTRNIKHFYKLIKFEKIMNVHDIAKNLKMCNESLVHSIRNWI